MTTNEQRRGPLGFRVIGSASGVRVWGLGEVALDPAEARRIAEALLAAATEADVLASELVHVAGCTAHLERLPDGQVRLRATHPTGQGRWLSEPHPLDGVTFDSPAEAVQAAIDAGLVLPAVPQ